MEFRKVKQDDYEGIYHLVEDAFKTARTSDGKEQNYVLRMREKPTYLPELEFVGEENGKLVAHLMLNEQNIPQENWNYKGVLITLLCVAFDYRNQEIGSDLLLYGLKEAEKLGYQAAFVIGDPIYYDEYGFHPIIDYGLENGNPVPDGFVLASELIPGALKNIKGKLQVER